MSERTTSQVLFNIILWFIVFIYSRKQIYSIKDSTRNYFFLGFITILFSTFGFNSGDYLNYASLYEDLVKSQFIIHVEPFYFWLCKVLPDNYFIWRFAIWGLATIFFIQTFKRTNCSPKFATLIFVLIVMWVFNNLRNALGYSVLLYGTTCLLFPSKNKTASRIWGAIWIFLSFFLHKSMFMYILLMGFSLIPLGKKLFITSLIAFPILYKSITHISSYLLLNSFANEASQESGTGYLESDFRFELNAAGILRVVIERLPIFLLIFYAIRNIYLKNEKVQYGLKVFLQYTYWLIYISYLFLGQEVSSHLTNRFWDASLYPLTIFLAGYLYKKPRSRFIKNCFYLLILSNLYNLSYSIFKTL